MKRILAIIESEAMQIALKKAMGRKYDIGICDDANTGAMLLLLFRRRKTAKPFY